MSKSENFLYIFTLYLSFFVFTEGFGIRMEWMGGLGKSQIGIYGILQLIQLVIMFAFFITENPLRSKNNDMCKYLKALYFLFLAIIVELLFQILIIDKAQLSDYSNLIDLRSYLLFWTLFGIYRKIGLTSFIKILKNTGIICSIILLVVVLFHIQNTQLRASASTSDVTRSFRLLAPTGTIITCTFFIYLSEFNKLRDKKSLLFAALCFGASFIQLHRSSTFSLLFVIFLYLILENKKTIRTYMIYIISIIGLIFVLQFIFNMIGYSWDNILSTITETRQGISDKSDYNATLRFFMIGNAIIYVIQYYIVLGTGLHWENSDFEDYLFNQFSLAPTGDNGYYNIILLFGILGVVIYSLLIYKMVKILYETKRKNNLNLGVSIYSRGLFYFLIYIVFQGMGSDSFILVQGFMFVVLFTLTFIINSKRLIK